jgi:hypothetical protein
MTFENTVFILYEIISITSGSVPIIDYSGSLARSRGMRQVDHKDQNYQMISRRNAAKNN